MAKAMLKNAPPAPVEVVAAYEAAAREAPQDVQAQLDLGWGLYGAGKHAEALEQFQRVLALQADSLDALYGLGLAHKVLGNKEAAVASFEKVAALAERAEDSVSGAMLRRLAHGHVNAMNLGDWQLEAEIWQREE